MEGNLKQVHKCLLALEGALFVGGAANDELLHYSPGSYIFKSFLIFNDILIQFSEELIFDSSIKLALVREEETIHAGYRQIPGPHLLKELVGPPN